MALADYVYRLKPQSGDAAPHDELGAGANLSGGTISLVDRGSGDYAWRFSAGASTAAVPSRAIVGGADNAGVTVAITLKVATYPTVDFTGLAGYTTDATVTNGLYIGQNGANNLRARVFTVLGTVLGAVGTSEYTWVLRLHTAAASSADTLDIWKTTAGRSGTAADHSTTGANLTGSDLDTLVVNAVSSAVVEIKDWVIWHEELSDADCVAVADGLRATLDGGGSTDTPINPGAGTITITGHAPAVTQSGALVLTPGAGSLSITGYAPTVAQTGNGTIVTPVLKNNTGTVLANETGVVVNVYNATTGALVVRKTGLTSSALGVVTITDAALVSGTTYAYEVVLSSNGRRLPTAAAA